MVVLFVATGVVGTAVVTEVGVDAVVPAPVAFAFLFASIVSIFVAIG